MEEKKRAGTPVPGTTASDAHLPTTRYPGTGRFSLRRSRTPGMRTISHDVYLNRSHEVLIIAFSANVIDEKKRTGTPVLGTSASNAHAPTARVRYIMKYCSVDLMKHLDEMFRRKETSGYPGTGHFSLRRSRTHGVRTISHEVFLNRSHEGLIISF